MATCLNSVVGKGNSLPWKIKEEMDVFKENTMGKIVIMGDTTFESIGKPLKGRINIVLSFDLDYAPEGVYVAHSITEAYKLAESFKGHDELFVIGGVNVLEQCAPDLDELRISVIQSVYVGDVFFPTHIMDRFNLIRSISYEKFNFEIYRKKS